MKRVPIAEIFVFVFDASTLRTCRCAPFLAREGGSTGQRLRALIVVHARWPWQNPLGRDVVVKLNGESWIAGVTSVLLATGVSH
jgi:hypothetical protein